MARREIIKEGDPVLRQVAQPVERVTKKLTALINDMAETMYAADGVGLAAPQIGEPIRVIVADAGDGLIALVNPVITKTDGEDIEVEGCLSIPGVTGYVKRYAQVQVQGLNEKGKPVKIQADGLLARILQHEIDHLDGILFIDKATSVAEDTE
ncbi:MAG TPA: peptide deformylase [Firmicutes bacterium]|nr:peptide deformylase [Bacillota bacterium]